VDKGAIEMVEKIRTALFMWDLPTEQRGGAPEDTRRRLEALRKSLWRTIRYKYGCFPYNESAYIIMDVMHISSLEDVVDHYKSEYKELGYQAKIDIVQYEYGSADLSALLEISFMTTLSKQIQVYEVAEADGKSVSPSTIRTSQTDIQWIKKGCNDYNIKSERVDNYIDILNEKILDHKKKVGKSTKAMKWTVT